MLDLSTMAIFLWVKLRKLKKKQFSLIFFFLPPILNTDVNFSYYGNQKLFCGGNKAKIRRCCLTRRRWELLHVGILNWNRPFTPDVKRRRMTACRLDLVVPFHELRKGDSL